MRCLIYFSIIFYHFIYFLADLGYVTYIYKDNIFKYSQSIDLEMFIMINFGYKLKKIFTIDCLAAALFDCIW